jgi:uncharacterized membrane-anchored protein YhcB (DUF1043 family)
MEPVLFNTIGAILILAVGTGLGYWLGNRHRSGEAAKASEVQEAFDDYRRNVTEHFGQTADYFQAIGKQYRELYEHMASGAEALCDIEDAGAGLSFPKAVAPALPSDDTAGRSDDADTPSPDADTGGDDVRTAGEAEGESEQGKADTAPATPAGAADAATPIDGDKSAAADAAESTEAEPPGDAERKPAGDPEQREERTYH